MKLFVHCKDTNLKAIHNRHEKHARLLMLFVHCKDTNLKAIHNGERNGVVHLLLFVHCKDTNLKAIHNQNAVITKPYPVVRALQRY